MPRNICILKQLEEATAGSLSLDEQRVALARLDQLPTHEAFNRLCVTCTDVGFKTDNVHRIYGFARRDLKLGKPLQVDPRSLLCAQHDIPVDGIRAYIAGEGILTGSAEERWAELPEVVIDSQTGAVSVSSGHTRLAAQMLAGRTLVDVKAWTHNRTMKKYESLKPAKTPQEIASKHGVEIARVEKALSDGTKVELEHTDDEVMAKHIASHHVFELIDYYDRLKSVEEAAGARLLIGSVNRDFGVRHRSFRIEQYTDDEIKAISHDRLGMGDDDFLWRFRTDSTALYWWTVPVDDDYTDAVREYIYRKTGITPSKNIDLEHVGTARKWAHGLSEGEVDVSIQKAIAAMASRPASTIMVDGQEIHDLRIPGQRVWFEYHCSQSHHSSDACVWYRSHQQVTVIGFDDGCADLIASTFEERLDNGQPLVYDVKFDDGFTWTVFEDELLDSPDEYSRDDPPPPPDGYKDPSRLSELAEKLLGEGLNDLYHATTLKALYRIVYDDLFELSYGRGDAESEIGNKPFFASFSRIPANRYRSHGADVTIIVDGDKLRQRHKIVPVDYWRMGGAGSESEERLWSSKPAISPFKQYLKAVHVYYDGNADRQKQYEDLQYFSVPVYVYRDRKAYFLLDTRRAQTAKEFVDSLGDAPLVPQPYTSVMGDDRELMRMDALLDFLESGGTLHTKPWYDRLRYYHTDFINQLACDVHNFRSKKGFAVRKIWQRFETLLAKYGAANIRGFARAFIAQHGR